MATVTDRLTLSEVSQAVVRWNAVGLIPIDDAVDLVGFILDTFREDPDTWRVRDMNATVADWRAHRHVLGLRVRGCGCGQCAAIAAGF